MKKIILVAAMVLGFAVAASAQPRAVGIRGTYGGAEVSYQHSLGTNFLEGNLGLASNGLSVAGTYNYMIAQPEWTSKGEWGFYAGPGAAVGLGLGQISYLNLAVTGQVGLEYTFWFPLQLSLDLRPQLGIAMVGELSDVYFGGWYPSLGVRYKF